MENQSRWCVFLPCSDSESWAVPQNCLAEIVTLHNQGERPPTAIEWRGENVPVIDLDENSSLPWREARSGTGLVAVILGLEGSDCKYWGVALRGEGLGMNDITSDDIEEAPELVLEHASSAFRINGELYQVPDLLQLQERVAAEQAAA